MKNKKPFLVKCCTLRCGDKHIDIRVEKEKKEFRVVCNLHDFKECEYVLTYNDKQESFDKYFEIVDTDLKYYILDELNKLKR